jgi:hypothetical protein
VDGDDKTDATGAVASFLVVDDDAELAVVVVPVFEFLFLVLDPLPPLIVLIDGTLLGIPMGLLECTKFNVDCSEDSKSTAANDDAEPSVDREKRSSPLSLYKCPPTSRLWS